MKKKRYLPFGYQMEKGEIIPHPDEGPFGTGYLFKIP